MYWFHLHQYRLSISQDGFGLAFVKFYASDNNNNCDASTRAGNCCRNESGVEEKSARSGRGGIWEECYTRHMGGIWLLLTYLTSTPRSPLSLSTKISFIRLIRSASQSALSWLPGPSGLCLISAVVCGAICDNCNEVTRL